MVFHVIHMNWGAISRDRQQREQIFHIVSVRQTYMHHWNLMIRCGLCNPNVSGDRRLSQRYLGEPELPKVTQP